MTFLTNAWIGLVCSPDIRPLQSVRNFRSKIRPRRAFHCVRSLNPAIYHITETIVFDHHAKDILVMPVRYVNRWVTEPLATHVCQDVHWAKHQHIK